jgi:lipoyl(octanoyl) transferase
MDERIGTSSLDPVVWEKSPGLVDYQQAVERMEGIAGAIADGTACERVWLLEHAPLYTAGTSARDEDLIDPHLLPVFRSGRGGRFTYHGPGQRVAYVMLDLARRGRDVRGFVWTLEEWLIKTLADFSVLGERRSGRVGVWVRSSLREAGTEEKIAAIGVRIRRWVSFHGISLNVEPDLSHYAGIIPCGAAGYGVTSLKKLGRPVSMSTVDAALKRNFESIFGPASSSIVSIRETRSPAS